MIIGWPPLRVEQRSSSLFLEESLADESGRISGAAREASIDRKDASSEYLSIYVLIFYQEEDRGEFQGVKLFSNKHSKMFKIASTSSGWLM
jgi:hypothetical protein